MLGCGQEVGRFFSPADLTSIFPNILGTLWHHWLPESGTAYRQILNALRHRPHGPSPDKSRVSWAECLGALLVYHAQSAHGSPWQCSK